MFKSLLARLWSTNPLWLIGVIVAAQFVLLPGFAPWGTVGLVVALAYIQNTTYALQSRAAMRNSNLYHLIAAVAASLSYFWSLQLLVTNKVPLILLAPYTFATVLATVHGNSLSIRIEKTLGIYVENLKGTAQFLKLWPSVAVLGALLVWQLVRLSASGVQVETSGGQTLVLGGGTLTLLVFLGVAGSFAFTILRTARSSDSYWFHTFAFLLNTAIDFAKLAILIRFKLNWVLFVPVTTGNVIGNLIGANMAQAIVARIKATFDVHVYSKDEEKARERTGDIPWPSAQLTWLTLALALQGFLIVSGNASFGSSFLLAFLSAWQQMSFTLKSRAGQRNNPRYLAWASVFSNGVWYLTLAPLALGGITWDKALPYVVGGAIGSLLGQLAAMRVESVTGALVNASVPAPAAKAATA